jgi:catechol 2,3-dioxygenase-like lactoylglutathione lyase family enzyme
MHPTGIIANLPVADLTEAREFYVDFLGLSDEGFNLGWVMRLSSSDGRAVVRLVQLITSRGSARPYWPSPRTETCLTGGSAGSVGKPSA